MHTFLRKSLLAPLAFAFWSFSTAYSDISIEMLRPEQGQLTGHSVLFQVAVESEIEIASATASVEGREVSLEFKLIPWGPVLRGVWEGVLDLEGLSGEQSGSVGVVDVLGNTQTAPTNTFIIDERPVLAVTEPLNYSVTAQQIRLVASCSDDSETDCRFLVEVVNDHSRIVVFESTASTIDEFIDLSSFDHSEVTLLITVIDSGGQETQQEKVVYVEGNPRLTLIQNESLKVLDVSVDRILYKNCSETVNTLEIFNRRNGQSSIVYNSPGSFIEDNAAFLTPLGAIFIVSTENAMHETIVDIRGDEIVELIDSVPAFALVVKGNYAIWNIGPKLILRDLIEGSNTTISETAGNGQNDLSEDGSVVYWALGESEQIFIYHEGTSTPLSEDMEFQIRGAITDGKNTIYQKSREVLGERLHHIALHDGSNESILLDTGTYEPYRNFDYDLADEWVALRKPGLSGQHQIWMFKVGETPMQRTVYSSSSQMLGVNERGELIFVNEERASKYISHPSGRFVELGNYIGETLWRDGRWLVEIGLGRTLFALNTKRESIPNILDFQKGDSGAFQLEFEAEEGKTLMLQSSENMQDWTDIREIDATETDIDIGYLSEGALQTVFFRILVQ